MLRHNRTRLVGRSAVHDDIFEMRVGLRQHAFDGRENDLPLIE